MDSSASEEYSMATFRPLLARLVQTPEYFSADDLKEALNHLFTPNVLHPAQVGAFLTALHVHRVERRPDSLTAAASVLRSKALTAAIEDIDKDFVVDIVGTGGDGYNLFNVSTTAAIVAAGAGARVVKVRLFFPINYFKKVILRRKADLKCFILLSMEVEHLLPLQAQLIYFNLSTVSSQHRPPVLLYPSVISHSLSFSHLITIPPWHQLLPIAKHFHSVRCSTSWAL